MPEPDASIKYVGDGVYVKFDGYGFELMANSHTSPTDTIYLEPEVLKTLNVICTKFQKSKGEDTNGL